MVYKVTRYMTELEAMVSSGQFKAKKKEPERMLADFNLYVKTKEALIWWQTRRTQQIKYAVKKIKDAMTLQTNQAMIKIK